MPISYMSREGLIEIFGSEIPGPAHIPPSSSYLPRPLEITYQDRGLTIKVGCKVFAFSSYAEAQPYIVRYYSDPEGTEKLYNEGKLFDQPKPEASKKKSLANRLIPVRKQSRFFSHIRMIYGLCFYTGFLL